MRRILSLLAVLSLLAAVFPMSAPAASKYKTWNAIVDDMDKVLNKSYALYAAGNVNGAKGQVNAAYFQFYEKLGFEKTVMSYISGSRATKVEYQFTIIKKAMTNKRPPAEVKAALDDLSKWLREDANQLDGTKESEWGVFLSSLLIITREGFEAIIVVGAIVAYLIKSGNAGKARAVYHGAFIALIASVLLAVALNNIASLSGANQEIIEGATMLVAVAVLFYVSNWMVGKAGAEAWSAYIKDKVESSLSGGSLFSLAFAAFLAVFREGAETILFYQALMGTTKLYTNMIWAGLGVGCALLAVIYAAIRFLSIKLPLKQFFIGTSSLLAVMAFSFLGKGIKELQEGNVIGVTPVGSFDSVELLGIYPTLETLLPQAVLLAVTLATFSLQMRKSGAFRKKEA
ncbi:MAG: FTR1 family iron permease [Acidaminococcales bacterium]|nr:FTR1 family iron permease [Acidaminococcales bacterium]